MRTFRTILYTLAGLYMVYWVIRIQAELVISSINMSGQT